ncbi:hypothetical protein EMEDMD4_950032 [Sinorhizobium medicae]|uniref:Uncharacterized protein n=1 Tax=Sinorhizobium medicae TaxID=110321 RepID=A0A508XCF0_9HYPH|nr:hypothetical protein EMEDMD4_950032 [Sinorhizobium medicae]
MQNNRINRKPREESCIERKLGQLVAAK